MKRRVNLVLCIVALTVTMTTYSGALLICLGFTCKKFLIIFNLKIPEEDGKFILTLFKKNLNMNEKILNFPQHVRGVEKSGQSFGKQAFDKVGK